MIEQNLIKLGLDYLQKRNGEIAESQNSIRCAKIKRNGFSRNALKGIIMQERAKK